MGWWGYGPLQGDTPADFQCIIEDILDSHSVPLDTEEGVKSMLTAQGQIMCFDNDESIFWHVLVIMVMQAGGPIELIKNQALAAIEESCGSEAEAFDNPEARRRAFRHLERVIIDYDGKPTPFESKGLFETIFDFMAKKENLH